MTTPEQPEGPPEPQNDSPLTNGEEMPEQTDNSVRDEDGDQDIDQEHEPAPGSV